MLDLCDQKWVDKFDFVRSYSNCVIYLKTAKKSIMNKTFFTILTLTFVIQSFSQKKISMKIDKRIEAITIFYTLATSDTLDEKPTPSKYYKDFDEYFEKYKNHESLNWYRNLDKWDAWDLSSIGLYLSKKYPFKIEIPYNGTQLKSSEMTTFLIKFNQFYEDCRVEKFLKTHKKEYKTTIKYTEKSIIESNVLKDVEKFFNKQAKGELIIFADILNGIGNNAITITDKEYQDTKIIKLAYLKDSNVIQTNETEVKFIPLYNVVAHEVSHLFVSDFIAKYKERLSGKKNLFLTTSNNETLKESEWENELDELIVRVCVSKLLGEKFGTQREMKEIENQSKHYKYFKELNLFFNKYTENRTKYKSITEFYPEILNFIETLK